MPIVSGSQMPKHVSPTQNSNCALVVGAQAERVDVERPRAGGVRGRHGDEVERADQRFHGGPPGS